MFTTRRIAHRLLFIKVLSTHALTTTMIAPHRKAAPKALALDPDGRGAWQSGPDPLTPGLWVVHADLSAPQAELAWRVLLEVGTR